MTGCLSSVLRNLKRALEWLLQNARVHPQIGRVGRENGYDVTNLHRGRFRAAQILQGVRGHWAIENNCNWTLDVIWYEVFFSSRRRHTRFDCDWSSDVCSSD